MDKFDEVYERELAERTKPSWAGSIYDSLSKTQGGIPWTIGLLIKLPYRTLVKNTWFYRERIQYPAEKLL